MSQPASEAATHIHMHTHTHTHTHMRMNTRAREHTYINVAEQMLVEKHHGNGHKPVAHKGKAKEYR